ncbi:hypothetical protein GALL_458620 [mine drainage metagenome]|uniref:Uncharacterized protein n=1 Tax=mine drainage metagenome TaxID=410659 RepID=A0A1J5PN01_9ZZZZ
MPLTATNANPESSIQSAPATGLFTGEEFVAMPRPDRKEKGMARGLASPFPVSFRNISRGLWATPSGVQLCRDILGNVEIVGDGLHIVILFQHVDQPHQLLRGFQIDLGAALRFPDQLRLGRLA